jgi:hypothetical protein
MFSYEPLKDFKSKISGLINAIFSSLIEKQTLLEQTDLVSYFPHACSENIQSTMQFIRISK